MPVVVVDHRDARAHEARDGEHRDSRAEGEGRVGVAQVVEAAQRLDAGSLLSRLPVAAAEAAEVERPPREFGNKMGFSAGGSWSSASSAFACSGTARLLSRVFVRFNRPFANARRT